MYNYLKTFSLFMIFLLVGCEQQNTHNEKKDQPKTYETYVIQKSKINDNIEQIGVITPLTHNVIVSSVSGFIEEQFHPYGSDIKKDEPLFKISGSTLSIDVFSKLVEYHNAKWDYESSKNKYQDYKLQFTSGLVANEEVVAKEIEFNRAKIKLLQTEFELKSFSEKIDKTFEQLTSIKIDDLQKFFIDGNSADSIIIQAPDNGSLIPLTKEPSEDNSGAAKPGSKVEGGQAFAALTNLNQGEILIELDENQILSLKNKMPVIVKPLSRPDIELSGYINAIKLFEFTQKSDNLTRYPVVIHVESKTNIVPGTRCKIIINMPSRTAIMVPINAIYDPYKNPYAILANGSKRPVKLGRTELDRVEIKSGLSVDEKILIPKMSDKKS
ncbi:MAG: hypothetical protein VX835_03265 [Pseudomonadota bacterium]|nr:hypothetical protein [Pseudomonadota bacterium]